MKNLITITIMLFTFTLFGQQISSEDWDMEAKTNIRLLPKYGNIEKTEKQKKSDKKFINKILELDSTHRKGSDHLIDLGFQYLNSDIRTAMYRFNQAYLLDSTNTDIYWGFGAVYMTLGDYQKAKEQYVQGLESNPANTHLLTDYGTYYMVQYYGLLPINEDNALKNLDTAIMYMTKSYELDRTDQNTTFKLSILYWIKDECDNAWRYYNECEALGGQPITEAYTSDLKAKCNIEKVECKELKKGKYKIEDELSGITIIKRTKKYQIEENEKLGVKMKFEIVWLDDCTYQLVPIEDLINPNATVPEIIITCKIIEATENYYVQISSSDVYDMELTSKVMRIK